MKMKSKIKIDREEIQPIIDKIYDIREKYEYDPTKMIFACYLAAEMFGKEIHISKKSKMAIYKRLTKVAEQSGLELVEIKQNNIYA